MSFSTNQLKSERLNERKRLRIALNEGRPRLTEDGVVKQKKKIRKK